MPPATLWVAWNKLAIWPSGSLLLKSHSSFLSLLALKDRFCSGIFRIPVSGCKRTRCLMGRKR